LIHQIEEMLERINHEEQRLIMMNLERLVDRPLELHWKPLCGGRFDGVLDLAKRAEQAAAIHTKLVAGAHEAEFNREPEESRHRLNDAGERANALFLVANFRHQLGRGMRTLAKADESIGEVLVSVHWHMPGHVVKDVRFRQVIKMF